MLFKILLGVVLAVVAWYVLREMLISLNIYISKSGFGKSRIEKKEKSKFKFRDPLTHR